MEITIIDKTEFTLTVNVNGENLTSRICRSSSRDVFIFDTFVVKFDTERSCGEQNFHERSFYELYLSKDDKQFFPELYAYGTYNNVSYLVQEKVTPVNKSDFYPEFDNTLLNNVIKKYSLRDVGYEYNYCRNFVVTADGFKIYDIGYSEMNW
jgi:hypothetical protein